MADYQVSVLFRLVDQMSAGLKNIRSQMSQVGSTLKGLGRDLTLKVTTPLTLWGGIAAKASMDFNRAMANIATLLDGTAEEVAAKIQVLKDQVRGMSKEFGKPVDDLAAGLYEVISAFGESTENVDQFRASIIASVAGLSSTKEALDLLSAVGKAYNNTSAEMLSKISDLSFLTVKLGKTNFADLAYAMQSVASVAQSLDVGLEELFGSFATLTGVTGTASEVSTQLVGVMKGILSPSEDLMKLFADPRVGYRSAFAMTKSIGLWKTLRFIFAAAGNDAERFAQIFGGRVEAMRAIFAAMGAQSDNLRDKTAKMGEAAGATAEAFRRITQGISKDAFTWSQLMETVKDISRSFGDVLTPELVRAGNMIIPVFEKIMIWFMNLDEGTKRWIIASLALTAALGPLLVILGTLAAVLGALSIPAGIGFAAIMGLIVIGGLLLSRWKGVVEYFKTMGPILYNFFIQPLIDAYHWVERVFEKIKAFEEWVRTGKDRLKTIFSWIGGIAEKITLPEIATPEMAGAAPGVGAVPIAAPGIMQHQIEGGRSQADVNIKVTADQGSRATVEGVRKSGEGKVDVRTESYLGAMPF